MYTKYLATDLAPHGTTVNSVAPRYIDMGKLRSNINDGAAVEAKISRWRLDDPDDCDDVGAFLADSDADYVTGTVIPVDGGSAELSLGQERGSIHCLRSIRTTVRLRKPRILYSIQ